MKYIQIDKIQEIVKKFSKAHEYIVHGYIDNVCNIRFHENIINREFMKRKETYLSITSYFQNKKGTAKIRSLDEQSIKDAINLSEKLAMQANEDPEYVPQLDKADYSYLINFYEELPLEDVIENLKNIFSTMDKHDLRSFGHFRNNQITIFFFNSAGLFHSWNTAANELDLTSRMKEGNTAWVADRVKSYQDLNYGALLDRVIQKTLASKNPKELSPGKYKVIMEAPAFTHLLYFLYPSLNEKDVDRGISAMSGKKNTTIMSKDISLQASVDDKYHYFPWSQEGVPARTVDVVKSGVLKEFYRDSYQALKTGKEPIFLGNLVLYGDKTKQKRNLNELMKEVDDGILISRFWYVRYVDPSNIILTGMTRDGLYKVENGKVIGALKHMRFNDSLLRILKEIKSYTATRGVTMGEDVAEFASPDVLVENFNFTSNTRF